MIQNVAYSILLQRWKTHTKQQQREMRARKHTHLVQSLIPHICDYLEKNFVFVLRLARVCAHFVCVCLIVVLVFLALCTLVAATFCHSNASHTIVDFFVARSLYWILLQLLSNILCCGGFCVFPVLPVCSTLNSACIRYTILAWLIHCVSNTA